jgi:hypothetical protein
MCPDRKRWEIVNGTNLCVCISGSFPYFDNGSSICLLCGDQRIKGKGNGGGKYIS